MPICILLDNNNISTIKTHSKLTTILLRDKQKQGCRLRVEWTQLHKTRFTSLQVIPGMLWWAQRLLTTQMARPLRLIGCYLTSTQALTLLKKVIWQWRNRPVKRKLYLLLETEVQVLSTRTLFTQALSPVFYHHSQTPLTTEARVRNYQNFN